MIKKVFKNLDEILLISLLVIMCVVLTLQVTFRYIFNTPLIWSEEVARYTFVWITMIGAGYGYRKHLHIEMTFIFNKMPANVKKIVQVAINIVSIVAFSYIIPESVTFMKSQHVLSATTFNMPLSVLFAAAPIGISYLVIRIIIDTYYVIIGKNPERVNMEKKTEGKEE